MRTKSECEVIVDKSGCENEVKVKQSFLYCLILFSVIILNCYYFYLFLTSVERNGGNNDAMKERRFEKQNVKRILKYKFIRDDD